MATKSSSGTSRGKQRTRSINGGQNGSRPLRPGPIVDLGSWGLAPKTSSTSSSSTASVLKSQSPQPSPMGVTNLRYLIYSTAAEPKLDTRRFPTWLRKQAQEFRQQLQRRHHTTPSAIVPPLSALQQLWRVVFAPASVGDGEDNSKTFSSQQQQQQQQQLLQQQQSLEALTSADWGLWILWLWHHNDWATLAQMHALALERPLAMAAKIPDEGLVLLTEARIRHWKAQQQLQHQQQQILHHHQHQHDSTKAGRARRGGGGGGALTMETTEPIVQWIQETAACLEGLGRRPVVELYELWIHEAYEARDWQQVMAGSKAMEQMQSRLVRRPMIHVQVELALACLAGGDVQGALQMAESALVDASLPSSSSADATPATLGTLSARQRGRVQVPASLGIPNDRWRLELAGLRERLLETAEPLAVDSGIEGDHGSMTATRATTAMIKASLYPLLLDALSSGEQDPRATQRAAEVFRDWLGQLHPSSPRSSSSPSVALTSTMDPNMFHKLVRFMGLSAGSGEAEALVSLLSSSLDAMRDGSKLSDTVGFESGSSSSSSSSSSPSSPSSSIAKTVVKKDKKHHPHSVSTSSSNHHSQHSGIDAQVAALRTLTNIGCQEVLVQALREGDMGRAKRMFQVLGAPALQPSSMLTSWPSGSNTSGPGSSSRHGTHSPTGQHDSDDPSSSSLSLWLTPVQNGLCDMYLEALVTEADFGMALTVLQKMLVHDRVPTPESLQRLVGGMVKSGQLVEAMGVYRELTEVFGVTPMPGLLHAMLGLAAKYGDLSLARKIRRMLVGMDKAAQDFSEPDTAASSMVLTLSPTTASHSHDMSSKAMQQQQQQQQEAYSDQAVTKVDQSRLYHDLMVCYMNHMNIPGAFRIFESMGYLEIPYEIRHINALLVGTMAKGQIPLPDTTMGILEVMTTLRLRPNAQTYRALLKAALLNRDRPLAERWFQELATAMLSGKESWRKSSFGHGDQVLTRPKGSMATGAFDHWQIARHGETFELLMGEYVRMYGVRPAVRLLEGVIEAEVSVPRPDVFRMLMAKSCDEADGRTGHRVFELMKQQQQQQQTMMATTRTKGTGAGSNAGGYLTSQASDLVLYHRLLEQVVEREQDIDRGQAIVAELIVSGVALDVTLVEDAIAVYAHRLETGRAAYGIYSRMKRVYGIRTPTPRMLASLDQLARKTAAAANAAAAASAAATTAATSATSATTLASAADVDQLSSSASA
ncbi:hypothetical protein DFQ26_007231 [Actinomortierella ambigua]|nr:hypothetical protein DFQ26_007231 [Actinomortierella ambigua]